MRNSEDLRTIIEQQIREISYPESPSSLYAPIEYIMKLKAKRMRPILVLMAHQLYDENIEKAISPALAVEIFHTFTLLHDDIMDNASLRRGSSTVHEKWDKNIAILSGDTMVVQAYKLITSVDNSILKYVLDTFNKAAVQVCEGQQQDMSFESKADVSLSEYMQMIEHKTAVLLAAALKIGGITAGASIEDQNNLYEFGKNIGIAFQLRDDFLDTFGSPDLFGKKLGGDIIANKKTFLYLKAMQLADIDSKKNLKSLFLETDSSEAKIKTVKKIFQQFNIPKHTTDMMRSYYIKALKHLDAIESQNKAPLIQFSRTLMDRIS